MKLAIVCTSGGFKAVFTHGVLSAFEESGFSANGYATCSSPGTITAYASIGKLSQLEGIEYWKLGLEDHKRLGSASKAWKKSLQMHGPVLSGELFKPTASQFVVAASAVITDEAASRTQGTGARRLGRELLLAIRKKDSRWADENLELHIFDNRDIESSFQLTANNLEEVIYASVRFLHSEWEIPASIGKRPYIDASYTCSCLANEMASYGYDEIIVISTEEGLLYRDFFQSEEIPHSIGNIPIYRVQPDFNLTELGLDIMTATPEAIDEGYQYGLEKGKMFLDGRGVNLYGN